MHKTILIAACAVFAGLCATGLGAQEACGSPSTFCPASATCTQTYGQCASVAFRCQGQREAASRATPWCELHCTVSRSCVTSIESAPTILCNSSPDCPESEDCIDGLCREAPVLGPDCPDCPEEPCAEPTPDPEPAAECTSEAQCVFGQVCSEGRCHGCPAGQVWVRPSRASLGAQCLDHPVRSCVDDGDCTEVETCQRVVGFGGAACIFGYAPWPPGRIEEN